jgi:hypothetical protein
MNKRRLLAMLIVTPGIIAGAGFFLPAGSGSVAAWPSPQARQRIKCESLENREVNCPARVAGNVVISRQISDTRCVEGRNWRWNFDGITVWGGCRADFEFDTWSGTRPRGGERMRIKCESEDGREARCPARVAGNVVISRQISDTRCVEGRNWRWNREGIVVWGGCRADFEFDTSRGDDRDRDRDPDERWSRIQRDYYDTGYRLGSGDARSRAPRDHARFRGTEYDARFEPYFAEGYYTGYDGRARRYDYRVPAGGWGSSGGSPDSYRVTCESSDGRYRECAISQRASVRLLDQMGRDACIENRSWGVTANGKFLWVNNGCRGVFEITPRR